ncbi:rod-binding protein [Roseovarius mucosus]|jgi:flagellar protein FlgJ|uniref:rod-binding protein n=1 Tax=Roseovarius mucosus TaxID=215743 RepID=UPI001C5D3FD2|nr:rod-binding protein [Roseovarius mucosus]MBW4973956.1 rod-binding protein [Roseovarius mucosus]
MTLPPLATAFDARQTASLSDDRIAAKATRDADRLRGAAEGFEALFLNQILQSGRAASFGDSLTESSATQTAQSLLDSTLTEVGAGRSGLGLSEAIYRQFSAHLGGVQE